MQKFLRFRSVHKQTYIIFNHRGMCICRKAQVFPINLSLCGILQLHKNRLRRHSSLRLPGWLQQLLAGRVKFARPRLCVGRRNCHSVVDSTFLSRQKSKERNLPPLEFFCQALGHQHGKIQRKNFLTRMSNDLVILVAPHGVTPGLSDVLKHV